MARYSGGPVTHHALTGPNLNGLGGDDRAIKLELLYTLRCVHEIRGKIDRTELGTVRQARAAGISWTEIAASLGVSRQAAWERWREIDQEVKAAT